ncbi:MAG: SDR family oxidoreductase [Novosphingobium sp.]
MAVQAFSGKLAFVTGAASGIGRAIAEEFGRRGLQVVVADIDLEGAERVAAGIKNASAVKLDVRSEESWIKALDVAESRHGALSVLVSNAGVAGSSIPLNETPFKAWEWSRSVNLDGAFLGLSHGARRIIASGEPGHIVATSSMSIFAPPPGMAIYVAMKSAVLALSEAMRRELAPHSIGVSALLPGPVHTNLIQANVGRAPSGVEIDQRDDLIHMLQQGKDPAAVGRQVADALGTDQFWLFTHPELEHRIDTRTAEMKLALHGG